MKKKKANVSELSSSELPGLTLTSISRQKKPPDDSVARKYTHYHHPSSRAPIACLVHNRRLSKLFLFPHGAPHSVPFSRLSRCSVLVAARPPQFRVSFAIFASFDCLPPHKPLSAISESSPDTVLSLGVRDCPPLSLSRFPTCVMCSMHFPRSVSVLTRS